MSNTGSDPTRPQTADADSEDAGTGDTLLTSTELTTTRSPTGDVMADTLLPPTEPQTTKHDADAVEVEENLLASAEQHDPDIIRDDTQNPRPTWRTRKPWKLAQQVIVTNHTRFTGLEFVLSILRIVLYVVDLVTDLHLASSYFQDGLVNYGALTTTFFGLAYIVVVFFGLARYVDNSDVPAAWWVCRIVFLILGLSPVILILEAMYYGCRSRARDGKGGEREEVDHKRYSETVSWAITARLLESFLEAAPQLCFQLYITFKEKPDDDEGTWRGIAVLSSWASLAVLAVKAHNSDTGDESTDNEKDKFSCKLFYFLWRVCETGGRVLCIALFASTFHSWVFGIVGFHFVVMFAWYVWSDLGREGAARTTVWGILAGYVMVFYMPFHSRPSRYLYLVYYALFYTENFLMLALWAVMTSDRDAWFYIPAIVTVIVLFLLHIVTQLLYYKCFHPKAGDIEFCVEFDRQSLKIRW